MEFIEASLFTRLIYSYLTLDEYFALQNYLLISPEVGDVVPGSGGVRKLRWVTKGTGKRGGVRIIYYFKKRESEIWLLTIYKKSETQNIPVHILKKIAEEIQND